MGLEFAPAVAAAALSAAAASAAAGGGAADGARCGGGNRQRGCRWRRSFFLSGHLPTALSCWHLDRGNRVPLVDFGVNGGGDGYECEGAADGDGDGGRSGDRGCVLALDGGGVLERGKLFIDDVAESFSSLINYTTDGARWTLAFPALAASQPSVLADGGHLTAFFATVLHAVSPNCRSYLGIDALWDQSLMGDAFSQADIGRRPPAAARPSTLLDASPTVMLLLLQASIPATAGAAHGGGRRTCQAVVMLDGAVTAAAVGLRRRCGRCRV